MHYFFQLFIENLSFRGYNSANLIYFTQLLPRDYFTVLICANIFVILQVK